MRVRPNCCQPTPNTDSDAIFAQRGLSRPHHRIDERQAAVIAAERPDSVTVPSGASPVCTENSNTHVVMVKPAEDRI
jgi:hypothetical protein